MRLCQHGLLGAADGANHRCTESLGPLAGYQADATGCGMDQDGVSGLDLVSPPQQVLHGQPLEHHRGRLTVSRAAASHPDKLPKRWQRV